jgi:hypothetical protein
MSKVLHEKQLFFCMSLIDIKLSNWVKYPLHMIKELRRKGSHFKSLPSLTLIEKVI